MLGCFYIGIAVDNCWEEFMEEFMEEAQSEMEAACILPALTEYVRRKLNCMSEFVNKSSILHKF